MDIEIIKSIVESRLLVGYLGEKNQANWWGTSFLSESSVTFLEPVFPNTTLLAQYNGVCQTAKRVHDEFIGVGQNYHLYRLPNSIEKLLSQSILNKEIDFDPKEACESVESALALLKKHTGNAVTKSDGPVAIGDFTDNHLAALVHEAVSHYSQAFSEGYKTYPYMRASS